MGSDGDDSVICGSQFLPGTASQLRRSDCRFFDVLSHRQSAPILGGFASGGIGSSLATDIHSPDGLTKAIPSKSGVIGYKPLLQRYLPFESGFSFHFPLIILLNIV